MAADYSVSYALDAGSVRDWGNAECEYQSPCKIVSRRTKLSISLTFRATDHRNVIIKVASDEAQLDCCWFVAGADEAGRDTRDHPIRLHLFAKRKARAEFFLNEPYGILYLQFLDVN